MTKSISSLSYPELFDKVKATLPGNDVALVMARRREALDYFMRKGFPKASREEWKYTRLGMFLTSPLALGIKSDVILEALQPFIIEDLPCYRMVFINGWFEPRLSDMDTTLAHNMVTTSEVLENANARDEMEALNLAFMTDGVLLRIPEDTVLDKPLHVIHINTGGAAYLRNKIVLEEGSKATVIESYVTPLRHCEEDVSPTKQSNAPHGTRKDGLPRSLWSLAMTAGSEASTNTVTEITLKPNASLEHYKQQQETMQANHVATTRVNLDKGSSYTSFVLTVGGQLSRNAIQVDMNGEGASTKLYGVYLGRGKQHLDHYMPVYHNAPRCFSEQKYKGVLDDAAKGIFYGKVFVPMGAQKTDARQSNHNLMLSEHAMAYSRPELEIHANDVKCSHGSATGMVDKDAMFYLRSRGINEEDATSLLVEGFVRELLEEIPQQSIKHYWQGVVNLWLGQTQ